MQNARLIKLALFLVSIFLLCAIGVAALRTSTNHMVLPPENSHHKIQ